MSVPFCDTYSVHFEIWNLTHVRCLRLTAWGIIPEQRGASPNVAIDNTQKVFTRNLHTFFRSAYTLYTSMHLNPSKHAEDGSDLATLFKEMFAARDVWVHFLGVWCISTSSRCFFLRPSILQGHRGISRPYSNQCFWVPSARSHHQCVVFPPRTCTGPSSSQVHAGICKWGCNVLCHPSRQKRCGFREIMGTCTLPSCRFLPLHRWSVWPHRSGMGELNTLTTTPLRWMYD